jgi:hypothetical protein
MSIDQKILEIPFLFFFMEMLRLLGRELFIKPCSFPVGG